MALIGQAPPYHSGLGQYDPEREYRNLLASQSMAALSRGLAGQLPVSKPYEDEAVLLLLEP